MSALGPFATGDHEGREIGATDAHSRIQMVREFDRGQCLQVLRMDVQKTVLAAAARRLRQLELDYLRQLERNDQEARCEF